LLVYLCMRRGRSAAQQHQSTARARASKKAKRDRRTVFRARKLDRELANIVLYKLDIPVAHHPVFREEERRARERMGTHTKKVKHTRISCRACTPPPAQPQRCEMRVMRISYTHSFMTSCSRRLLGEAIARTEWAGGAAHSAHGDGIRLNLTP
jgi:hypothetical protein